MAVAVKPSEDQLKRYAEQLPQIYKDMLEAVMKVEPERRHGDSFAFSSIEQFLRDWNDVIQQEFPDQRVRPYESEELWLAMQKLVENGFFIQLDRFARFAPTELGESLLGVVTGVRARKLTVPELPNPTW